MAEEIKTTDEINENLDELINGDSDNSNEDKKEEIDLTQPLEKPTKQQSLIKKVLIGVIGFLILLIITGITLYSFGFFDPEPISQPIEEKEIKDKDIDTKPKYNFNIKEINTKKLNEQLSLLTNKNLNQEKLDEEEKIRNEKKLLEEQKQKEAEELKAKEDSLIKEKEALQAKKQELEEQKIELENLRLEAIAIKEEMQNSKKILETVASSSETKTTDIVEDTNNISLEEKADDKKNNSSEFVLLINVAKIKGELYKSYLDKVSMVDSNVKLCRDDKNRIEIYFGPFNDENTRKDILNKLSIDGFKESFSVELTKEEFDRRCNY